MIHINFSYRAIRMPLKKGVINSFSGIFVILILLCFPFVMQAQTLAFPGAEGYGSYAEGGRGGEILTVTNLNDDGPGSLREAINHPDPRIIVFEVAGVISLTSPLEITDPYITIAGQTAPPPGITIRGEQTEIKTNHIIIRFIRFRPGDYNDRVEGENNWDAVDAVDIGLRDSDEVHDIIFDHCSFSWATDENIGIWHNTRNLTIQNSIISEPLHLFPEHNLASSTGKGMLIGWLSNNISIIKNLFAHNYNRHPYMNANGHLDFRNNLIYNPGDAVVRFNNHQGILQTVNVVNNLIIPGPNSTFENEVNVRRTTIGIYNGEIHIDGNISQGKNSSNRDNWLMVVNEETRSTFTREVQSIDPFETINTETVSARELPRLLTPYVGAFLPQRDQIDNRIIDDFTNRSGKLISKPSDVLGWPKTDPVNRSIDPFNQWQTTYNIDFSNPDEANADYNNNGYTNIEEFLNGTDPLNDESDKVIRDIYPPSMGPSTASTGQFSIMDSNQQSSEGFALNNNYPNPFNSSTNFHVSIYETGDYKLEIFNTAGQKVTTILNRRLLPGEYETRWDANGLSSGVYFVRLTSADKADTGKIILIK
ncbi:MAG: T9SS type A sorting domain-containing protein [Balneolaceae bacterium]